MSKALYLEYLHGVEHDGEGSAEHDEDHVAQHQQHGRVHVRSSQVSAQCEENIVCNYRVAPSVK